MNIINPSVSSSQWESKIISGPLIKETKSSKDKKKIKNENQKNIKTFDELIEEIIPQNKEPELNQLWKELPIIEKKLIENPTEEHLEQYKKLVKNIAELQLKKNMKIETLKRKTTSGKEIILSYVKIIDEKLHKMMLAIQSKKNTAFEILRNLKEIRGLLLDLKQ
jgi:uncharacterized protein YaaR (DUF327 family)